MPTQTHLGEYSLITDAWAKVMAFPDVLFDAIQLPGLSELEVKAMQEPKRNP